MKNIGPMNAGTVAQVTIKIKIIIMIQHAKTVLLVNTKINMHNMDANFVLLANTTAAVLPVHV